MQPQRNMPAPHRITANPTTIHVENPSATGASLPGRLGGHLKIDSTECAFTLIWTHSAIDTELGDTGGVVLKEGYLPAYFILAPAHGVSLVSVLQVVVLIEMFLSVKRETNQAWAYAKQHFQCPLTHELVYLPAQTLQRRQTPRAEDLETGV